MVDRHQQNAMVNSRFVCNRPDRTGRRGLSGGRIEHEGAIALVGMFDPGRLR